MSAHGGMDAPSPPDRGLRRVDRDRALDYGAAFRGRLWRESEYPALGRKVATVWFEAPDDGDLLPYVQTHISLRDVSGAWVLCERRTYEPAHSTPGGLLEAHEAACAQVERAGGGALPPWPQEAQP